MQNPILDQLREENQLLREELMKLYKKLNQLERKQWREQILQKQKQQSIS